MIVFRLSLCYNLIMKSKKYQVFNIITFILASIMLIFGLSKIGYYGSHRALYSVDYREISNYISAFIFFVALFIFSLVYYKKGKCKVAEIIFYCLCLLFLVGYCKTFITQMIKVYISDLWLPNSVDYFTSTFESIFGICFIVYLVSTFIYKIVKNYYKRG